MKFNELYKAFRKEVKVYKRVLNDKRTPKAGKFVLGLAIGYLLFPFDFIPDFIPILGQLDELVVIPLLVYIALKLIPKELIDDNRRRVKE